MCCLSACLTTSAPRFVPSLCFVARYATSAEAQVHQPKLRALPLPVFSMLAAHWHARCLAYFGPRVQFACLRPYRGVSELGSAHQDRGCCGTRSRSVLMVTPAGAISTPRTEIANRLVHRKETRIKKLSEIKSSPKERARKPNCPEVIAFKGPARA